MIHGKVEVARFNNGSDYEFPTEFLIARYMLLHCIKYITTNRDSACVSFLCLDSIGTL